MRYFHDDGETRYFIKNEFDEYDNEKIQEYLEKYFTDDSAGELFKDVEDVYEWLDVDGVDVIILGEIEWKEDWFFQSSFFTLKKRPPKKVDFLKFV